jgi:hypothetical protein
MGSVRVSPDTATLSTRCATTPRAIGGTLGVEHRAGRHRRLAWWIYGFVLGAVGFSLSGGRDVFSILVSTLVAAVPALTCLVAGWLLRSWSGMIVAALVYVAASALMWMLAAVGDLVTAEFALYVVLPAVVLSAIGTFIGIAIAGRRG